MYRVIALYHEFKNNDVKPCYIAKTYNNKDQAEAFVESQKNHSTFYFEIEKVA